VLLIDVDDPGLVATATSGDVACVVGDVTVPATWVRAVEEAKRQFGTVDVLIHNAGGSAGVVAKPIETVTEAEWDAVVDLNLRSAFLGVRVVAPLMKSQQYGRIVLIGSETIRSGTMSGIQAYPAAKAALSGFVRQLAFELGPFGVTANVVAPGLTLSSDRAVAEWEARPVEQRRSRLQRIPLGRLGTPQDVADVVLFVASERAGYVTGQTIYVDGGHAAF
jgi:3-oxoacyl-[acyl-carrier protein] reductase